MIVPDKAQVIETDPRPKIMFAVVFVRVEVDDEGQPVGTLTGVASLVAQLAPADIVDHVFETKRELERKHGVELFVVMLKERTIEGLVAGKIRIDTMNLTAMGVH